MPLNHFGQNVLKWNCSPVFPKEPDASSASCTPCGHSNSVAGLNTGDVLVAQSCPTLCNPMGCSPPGSSVHGILWEYWSGLPFPSARALPDPGPEPRSPSLQADSLPSEPPESTGPGRLRQAQIQWLQGLGHTERLCLLFGVWLLPSLWSVVSSHCFWSAVNWKTRKPVLERSLCRFEVKPSVPWGIGVINIFSPRCE